MFVSKGLIQWNLNILQRLKKYEFFVSHRFKKNLWSWHHRHDREKYPHHFVCWKHDYFHFLFRDSIFDLFSFGILLTDMCLVNNFPAVWFANFLHQIAGVGKVCMAPLCSSPLRCPSDSSDSPDPGTPQSEPQKSPPTKIVRFSDCFRKQSTMSWKNVF